MFPLLESLLEQNDINITYHISPVKFDPNNKWGIGYNELYDYVNSYEDDSPQGMKEWEILKRTLKAYEKGMGNVSAKNPNQIYVSSQPQAWKDVQVDELDITYKFGGIYVIITKRPVKEHNVPSGMGQTLPEAIINISDIVSYYGPFKTKDDADSFISHKLK